ASTSRFVPGATPTSMSPETDWTVTWPWRVDSMRTSPDTDFAETSPPTDVAADRLDARVAVDVAVDDEVARGALHLERRERPAQLHVCGGGGEHGVARVRHARTHAQRARSPADVADLDTQTEALLVLDGDRSSVLHDLGLLDEPVAADELDRRLGALDRLDLDGAGRDLDLELDGLRGVEGVPGHLRRPCGRRTSGPRRDPRRSSG